MALGPFHMRLSAHLHRFGTVCSHVALLQFNKARLCRSRYDCRPIPGGWNVCVHMWLSAHFTMIGTVGSHMALGTFRSAVMLIFRYGSRPIP